jgi:hypothetical protein
VKITAKELMHLEDYLTMEQTCGQNLSLYANQVQDEQSKTMLQQMVQKSQGNYQRLIQRISDQNMQ